MKDEDIAKKYFFCKNNERAAFEAGIKLGTIYHQFIGSPVTRKNVRTLEKAIEDGARAQPFVTDVKVEIDRKKLYKKRSVYGYKILTPDMLKVWLRVEYENYTVECELKHIAELKYPLMYVTSIKKV